MQNHNHPLGEAGIFTHLPLRCSSVCIVLWLRVRYERPTRSYEVTYQTSHHICVAVRVLVETPINLIRELMSAKQNITLVVDQSGIGCPVNTSANDNWE